MVKKKRVNLNTPEYWDKRYSKLTTDKLANGVHSQLYHKIALMIMNEKPYKVLELGCGNGSIPYWLNKIDITFLFHICYLGVDFSPVGLKSCRDQNIITMESYVNVPMDIWERHFNLAICIEVLEHLDEWNITLQNMYKHLSYDGKIIVSIPDGHIQHPTHVHKVIDNDNFIQALNENSFNVLNQFTIKRWNVFVCRKMVIK